MARGHGSRASPAERSIPARGGFQDSYSLVKNYTEFMDALGRKTRRGVQAHQLVPAFHLSMHGNDDALRLMDDKVLTWRDLNWKFRLVNSKVGNRLVVCLSSCYGLSGATMIRNETIKESLTATPPFRLLVSNLNAVPWSDAAIGFATFYHHLAKGTDLDSTIRAMRLSSGNDGFFGILVNGSDSHGVSVVGAETVKAAIERR